jgi:hypothetical protein
MQGGKAMAGGVENDGGRRRSRWRIAVWATTAAAGGIFEVATRMTGNNAYRAAVCIAGAAAFLLVWMNLAVGIMGSEDNPPT